MTSFRQFAANRRNALHSTGPKTESGKQQSRLYALRHGLTAETVIRSLEDAEDYKAFEAAVTADYDARTAVERELVLRLASLLWRLRRATAVETDLLEIQAEGLRERQDGRESVGPECIRYCSAHHVLAPANHSLALRDIENGSAHNGHEGNLDQHRPDDSSGETISPARKLTYCFLRLVNLDSGVFERLNRYEAALWRQTVQTLFALHPIRQRG
jgi:hypothetical protein